MKKTLVFSFSIWISACGPFASEPFYERDEAPVRPEKQKIEEMSAAELAFLDIKKTIIDPHCIKCHNPQNPKGDVDLSSLKAILKNPETVRFGEPLKSTFYTTIVDGDMPKRAEPLPMDLVDKTYDWILNN